MRPGWLAVAALGAATLAMSVVTLDAMSIDGTDYPVGYGSAVYAVEFARTPAGFDVFGGPPGNLQRMADMRAAHWLDYPFIALFTAFTALWMVMRRREAAGGVWLAIGAAVAVVAGLADVVEDVLLMRMMGSDAARTLLSGGTAALPELQWLWLPVHVKFLGIGVVCALAGASILREPAWAWKALGAVAVVGGIASLVVLAAPSRLGAWSGTAIGVAWLAMLLFAAVRGARG